MIDGERAYLRGHFRRIGFVTFSAKEEVGFTSREMKTEIEEESKNSYDIILFYVKVSGVSTHILLKIIYFTIICNSKSMDLTHYR